MGDARKKELCELRECCIGCFFSLCKTMVSELGYREGQNGRKHLCGKWGVCVDYATHTHIDCR